MRPRQTNFSSRTVTLALSLLACLLAAGAARAQTTTTGAVEGQITDSNGKGVPAIVQFINNETGVQTAVRTNEDGHFIKNLLQPGTYTIRVRVQGYKPFERVPQDVYLTRTRQVLPPIVLEPDTVAVAVPAPTPAPGGEIPAAPATPKTPPTESTSDRKTEAAANQNAVQTGASVMTGEGEGGVDIETTDGRRGDGFTEKEVSTLPLGSITRVRTFDELALYLPGVAPPPQTQGDVAGPGIGAGVGSAGQFSVNGLRSRGNNFTVDGSDNNDEDIGVRRQGFLALVPQPVESIQEYRVTTLLAPAQYGRNFGAQVDAVSKSGGNETHGTIFGFLNASQLNSRNFFDTVGGSSRVAVQGRPLNLDGTLGTPVNVFVNGQQRFETNNATGEDSFTLGQGGFTLGGPLIPTQEGSSKSMFYFMSAEGHILNATKEANFAVPTVEERGAFRTGASGLFFNPLTCRNFSDPRTCRSNPIDFYFPTGLQGDAIFSLFPFPNNPNGIFGRNTLTQSLPARGQSKIASGKVDANFRAFDVLHQFTARYNFTDDWRDIPVTGGAIFSSLRPNVRTQNFSTILSSTLTNTISNEFRASYGRTKLNFEELRHPSQLQSNTLPGTPFLLNMPFLSNFEIPSCNEVRCFPNTNRVDYEASGTTERGFFGDGDIFAGALGPVGQVVIAGYNPIGVDVFNFPQRRVNNTYQLADTLTLRAGRHSLAFGTDLRRIELNSDLQRNARTLITFNGAPRLLFPGEFGGPNTFRFDGFFRPVDLAAAEAASGVFQTLRAPGGSSNIGLRYYQLNFFGQDEWRVRPNLSISYGLRYEYTTPAREVNRAIESQFGRSEIGRFVPGLQRFIAGRTELFDADRNNFAPRVGFAWSPRPSTVIRAGYGWYYDQIIGAIVSQSRNQFPGLLTLNTGGGFGQIFQGFGEAFNIINPNLFIAASGTLNTLDPSLSVADLIELLSDLNFSNEFSATLPARDLESPMAHHYSATVEQQIGANLVLSASYVGTKGQHLLRQATPNLGPNRVLLPLFFNSSSFVPNFIGQTLSPGSRVTSAGNIVGGRPVSGVGPVTIFETTANSRYDALQLQARGRFARGLQFQAQYTFSRAEDDVSDVFDLAGASALPQNSLTRAGERADSNFDARHRIAYNLIYSFPTYANRSRAYRLLLGGLEVASTGQFQTGQPFTVNSIFDVNLDGNLTDRLNTTSGIVATGDRQRPITLQSGIDPTTLLAAVGSDGSVPRNSFRASNLLLINVAVIKHFRFGESRALTFRTEFFNVTNRANFGIPVRFLEAPGFGQATDTVTPGRRIQFALKFSF